jgi:hypothetical protein
MRPDSEYIQFDPYMDESHIACRKVRIVVTRKEHDCFCPNNEQYHAIPRSTLARYETAIVDGKWGRYYTCLACIDWHLDEDLRDGEHFNDKCPCQKEKQNGQVL